jgi:hypothetical protein
VLRQRVGLCAETPISEVASERPLQNHRAHRFVNAETRIADCGPGVRWDWIGDRIATDINEYRRRP